MSAREHAAQPTARSEPNGVDARRRWQFQEVGAPIVDPADVRQGILQTVTGSE